MLINATGFMESTQVDQVTRGVAFMLDGRTLAPVALPFLAVFLYSLVLLTTGLQIVGILFILLGLLLAFSQN